MSLLFELVAVAALILLNAFFVAAEYGLVTSRRTRIVELEHQGNRRARAVVQIVADPPCAAAACRSGSDPGVRSCARFRPALIRQWKKSSTGSAV